MSNGGELIDPRAVRRFRNNRGLTQLKLAKEVGVSEETVRKWEKQICRITSRNFSQLVKVLGVDHDQIRSKGETVERASSVVSSQSRQLETQSFLELIEPCEVADIIDVSGKWKSVLYGGAITFTQSDFLVFGNGTIEIGNGHSSTPKSQRFSVSGKLSTGGIIYGTYRIFDDRRKRWGITDRWGVLALKYERSYSKPDRLTGQFIGHEDPFASALNTGMIVFTR